MQPLHACTTHVCTLYTYSPTFTAKQSYFLTVYAYLQTWCAGLDEYIQRSHGSKDLEGSGQFSTWTVSWWKGQRSRERSDHSVWSRWVPTISTMGSRWSPFILL